MNLISFFSYNLNDPDLQFFRTNTKIDREINNKNKIYSFLNDMNYNINYGDKKSIRYYFIKALYYGYQHLGSGFVFPSDPDELVDQLKLLYFEKVGGNDSFLLNEQIISIVDELLEYECITPSQDQNIQSNSKKDPFVD